MFTYDCAIPDVSDTIQFMTDHLVKGVKFWPFRSDSVKWDLNGVKAPFIRKSIIRHENSELFKKANASVMVGDGMKEWIRVSQDSVVSYGIEGINLFKNGILYTGYYSEPRIYRLRNAKPMFRTYRLIFTCELKSLPEALQNQLPYHPDSIRVAVEFSEQTDYQPGVQLDLNLQRYNTIAEYKLLTQLTRLETRKSKLAWQDVTRFVKFPQVFITDTIRRVSFYTDLIKVPIASVYYHTVNQVEKIIYRSPDTFKDLTTIQDFKPNLFFFPNPYAKGDLRCELVIVNAGLYTFRVVNIAGTEIKRDNFYLDQSKTIDLDLSELPKGTYFLRLEQDRNHVISTKRLFVIR